MCPQAPNLIREFANADILYILEFVKFSLDFSFQKIWG